ncbi:hypothetical protein KCU73_g9249, partial [Aureobasidium melanogenum]
MELEIKVSLNVAWMRIVYGLSKCPAKFSDIEGNGVRFEVWIPDDTRHELDRSGISHAQFARKCFELLQTDLVEPTFQLWSQQRYTPSPRIRYDSSFPPSPLQQHIFETCKQEIEQARAKVDDATWHPSGQDWVALREEMLLLRYQYLHPCRHDPIPQATHANEIERMVTAVLASIDRTALDIVRDSLTKFHVLERLDTTHRYQGIGTILAHTLLKSGHMDIYIPSHPSHPSRTLDRNSVADPAKYRDGIRKYWSDASTSFWQDWGNWIKGNDLESATPPKSAPNDDMHDVPIGEDRDLKLRFSPLEMYHLMVY